MNGMGEEEAEPVDACGCFRSTQNILTDLGEEQIPSSCCDASRELSHLIPVRFIEYQVVPSING